MGGLSLMMVAYLLYIVMYSNLFILFICIHDDDDDCKIDGDSFIPSYKSVYTVLRAVWKSNPTPSTEFEISNPIYPKKKKKKNILWE